MCTGSEWEGEGKGTAETLRLALASPVQRRRPTITMDRRTGGAETSNHAPTGGKPPAGHVFDN